MRNIFNKLKNFEKNGQFGILEYQDTQNIFLRNKMKYNFLYISFLVSGFGLYCNTVKADNLENLRAQKEQMAQMFKEIREQKSQVDIMLSATDKEKEEGLKLLEKYRYQVQPLIQNMAALLQKEEFFPLSMVVIFALNSGDNQMANAAFNKMQQEGYLDRKLVVHSLDAIIAGMSMWRDCIADENNPLESCANQVGFALLKMGDEVIDSFEHGIINAIETRITQEAQK